MIRKVFSRALGLLLAAGILAACGVKDPETRVDIIDDRPQIAITNAPSGAVLLVNGVSVGDADDFDGDPVTLRVPKGTHRIEVVDDGKVLLSETVFLAGDVIRTLAVPAGR